MLVRAVCDILFSVGQQTSHLKGNKMKTQQTLSSENAYGCLDVREPQIFCFAIFGKSFGSKISACCFHIKEHWGGGYNETG